MLSTDTKNHVGRTPSKRGCQRFLGNTNDGEYGTNRAVYPRPAIRRQHFAWARHLRRRTRIRASFHRGAESDAHCDGRSWSRTRQKVGHTQKVGKSGHTLGFEGGEQKSSPTKGRSFCSASAGAQRVDFCVEANRLSCSHTERREEGGVVGVVVTKLNARAGLQSVTS